MTDLHVVGESLTRVDASKKVMGEAVFPTDLYLPDMLHGKVIRSPHPHARIISIDTSIAERLPGVRTIATPFNTVPMPLGLAFCDRYVFPPDFIVRFVGDAVAAVAADSEDIAEEAMSLINVNYEELPAVLDVEESYTINPPSIIHPGIDTYFAHAEKAGLRLMRDKERPNVCRHFKIRKGDVDQAFKKADLIVEDRYSTARIQHCQLEPCTSVAWLEPDGTLRLRSSTQGVHIAKNVICKAFNLPPDKVIVECPYIGGSFGGRGSPTSDPYAVLLSLKTNGRPVRVSFTREEHFHCAHSRVGVVTYIKDGVKRDGTITARQLKVLVDTGAYSQGAMMLIRNCAFGAVGIYNIPNFKFDSYGVYTNTPIATAFRGFGSQEIIWAIENQMDAISERLGLHPLEMRRRNLLQEGDTDVCGQKVQSIGIERCLERVKQWIEWDRKPPIENSSLRRGKGIALGNKYTVPGYQSSAMIKVNNDGSVEVRHSTNEIGMGIDTVAAQIAAESFGIPLNRVKVIGGDTSACPYGDFSASSRETFHVGNAVLKACEIAKRDLCQIAAPMLGETADGLDVQANRIFVKGQPGKSVEVADLFPISETNNSSGKYDVVANYTFQVPALPEDPDTGQSERIVAYYSYGAVAVEVAVDTETGEVQIVRDGGCFDGGTPINPRMCEGQIEGGMVMGIGATLFEQQIIGEKGETLNPNFHDYTIPTVMDVPDNQNMAALLAPTPHPDGPFGAKGIGEVSITAVPSAISNAIYNAIGVRIKDMPITSQKILEALNQKTAKTKNK